MTETTHARLTLEDAERAAVGFLALIGGTCERVATAGAVRRRAPFVSVVDIVVVPHIESVPQENLFGEVVLTVDVDRLGDRLAALVETGAIARRRRADGRFVWGPTTKLLAYDGVPIALYAPEPERFGWVLACQTGPTAFRNALMTRSDERTASGRSGLMPPRYAARDGWLVERMTGQRIVTEHERDVFELFGLDYLDPWDRT